MGDKNRPYPDGIAWDEALRQRRRAEAAEAKLAAIAEDGTDEHNAALELRAEVARLRGVVDAARIAICGADWTADKWISDEAMSAPEWQFVEQYRLYARDAQL